MFCFHSLGGRQLVGSAEHLLGAASAHTRGLDVQKSPEKCEDIYRFFFSFFLQAAEEQFFMLMDFYF